MKTTSHPGSLFYKILRLSLAAFWSVFVGLSAHAQLPELPSGSTLSGAATTASFYGGVSAADGVNYQDNFSPDQAIDIQLQVQVETDHINSLGSLFLVVEVAQELYMLDESGAFLSWDGTLEALLPGVADLPLAGTEVITVAKSVTPASVGIFDAVVHIYMAYTTVAAPNELYYTGIPLSFSIGNAAAQSPSFSFFKANISAPIIQSRCINCHVSGGLAAGTALVYANSQVADHQLANYNTLFEYIKNAPAGSDLILSKPQGASAHGGGVQLAASSQEFQWWSQFVALVKTDIANSGGAGRDIFAQVRAMSRQQTLRKAALLFAGRLPTAGEMSNVANASDLELKQTIRGLMTGQGFHQFLTESANDRLLSRALSANLFFVLNPYYYPNTAHFLETSDNSLEMRLASAAIADEPLELIAHVVENERPYTEVLTADYIMVNPYSAAIYGGNVDFDDPADPFEWREGTITEYYRCDVCTGSLADASYEIPTVYPHAGILNSPAFLSRFPSSDSNRNRARSRWTYYFFLGVDIEGLSKRTTDQAALTDEDTPTLNNPNCTVCHDIMDPVAGAFQNYNDLGFYKSQPGGEHSLPWPYLLNPNGGYQPGDVWYRDMLAPGFGQSLAPDSDNSLQWLAQQLVNDNRFGFGTVNFWYPTVMGRDPYAKPENSEDADYQSRLAAYNAEQAMMNRVAESFVNGSSGNGNYNLKDLLLDLVMSEHFRADSVEVTLPIQTTELDAVGSGKLLSPEQLSRKLKDITGYEWAYGDFNALEQVYNLIYGGIDSYTITERSTELTTLMSSVVAAMANETSCSIVSQEFGMPAAQRKLFGGVELSFLPTTNPVAIRNTIAHLHEKLLAEQLPVNDVEIAATYALFEQIWQARVATNKSGIINTATEICIFEHVANPVEFDANQTHRSWVAVLNYLLRDYKFIHD